jgi:hypothetical protein
MSDLEKVLAWIEPAGDMFVATLLGKPSVQTRQAAKKAHRSPDQARQWVEAEAVSVGLPIEWADAKSGRSQRPGFPTR